MPPSLPIEMPKEALKPPTYRNTEDLHISIERPIRPCAFFARFKQLVSTAEIEDQLPTSLFTIYGKETYLRLAQDILPELIGQETYQCFREYPAGPGSSDPLREWRTTKNSANQFRTWPGYWQRNALQRPTAGYHKNT